MVTYKKIRRKLRDLKVQYLKKTNYQIKSDFGFKVKLSIDRDVDRFFYLDNFESDVLHFFSNILKPGDVVFDIGANIGIYSLIASRKLFLKGKVYSFEPSDWAYNRLLENIRLNSFDNIKVINKALSDHSGHADLYLCEDDAYNSLGERPMKEVINQKNVEVLTLDEFLEVESIKKVDVVKIDTEGADFLVLKGGIKTFELYSPMIFCEYNRYTKVSEDFSLSDMLILLGNLGYEVYELSSGKLIKFEPRTSSGYELICLKESHRPRLPVNIF